MPPMATTNRAQSFSRKPQMLFVVLECESRGVEGSKQASHDTQETHPQDHQCTLQYVRTSARFRNALSVKRYTSSQARTLLLNRPHRSRDTSRAAIRHGHERSFSTDPIAQKGTSRAALCHGNKSPFSTGFLDQRGISHAARLHGYERSFSISLSSLKASATPRVVGSTNSPSRYALLLMRHKSRCKSPRIRMFLLETLSPSKDISHAARRHMGTN